MSVAVDRVRPRHDSEIPEENGAIASEPDRGVAPPLRPPRPHPVRQYVARVASLDVEEYPKWDLSKPLPKLPVPELHGTLDKYLRAIKPVVSADQYDKTATLAAEFGKPGGLGCYLQRKLEEYADNTDNWAYQWWLNDMYMNVKLPLPCNSNVGMVFPRQSFPELHNMFKYTARLISGIMDYKLVIDSKTIPVDRCRHLEKGQPMCMTQYYRLFTTYRAPGIDHDSQISYQNKTQPAPQHVLVICKNQFFVLDVVINSTCLSVDNIYTQLKRIYMAAEEGVRGSRDNIPRVGLLTAGQRDHWAIARSKLLEDPTNRETLDMIEKAIFVLCLDEKIPTSFNHQRNQQDEMEGNQEHRDDVSLAKQMLYGLGTGVNSCNRWFDKTMQFIVCEDGACGLNYEHSPSEGIAVVQLIEHLLRYMKEVKQRKLLRMNTMHDIPAPRRLEWHLEPCTHQVIQETALSFEKMISTLDLYVMRFNEYGKNFPKSQNMSPDAYIQLALQLTYYKVHAKLVSTYESASIRRFRFGRVDNIRACTMEALDWCRAMIGETEVTDEKKMELFRRAMKKQTDILQQTILGHGMDNHLLGLRQIAAELGMPKPALFEDESYQMSNHFTLSTSQVPTTMDAFMCYGAVVPDGYGACYNPHPDYILVVITSFNTCGETQSDFFAFTLEGSFMQMKELCVKLSQSAKENGVNLSQSTQESNLSAVNNNVIHPIKGQHLENGRQ